MRLFSLLYQVKTLSQNLLFFSFSSFLFCTVPVIFSPLLSSLCTRARMQCFDFVVHLPLPPMYHASPPILAYFTCIMGHPPFVSHPPHLPTNIFTYHTKPSPTELHKFPTLYSRFLISNILPQQPAYSHNNKKTHIKHTLSTWIPIVVFVHLLVRWSLVCEIGFLSEIWVYPLECGTLRCGRIIVARALLQKCLDVKEWMT